LEAILDMLTIKKLQEMEPNTVFAKGIGYINHPWYSSMHYKNYEDAWRTVVETAEGGLTKVKWIASRGGIHDWSIFHSLSSIFEVAHYLDGISHLDVNWERIRAHGAKLHDKKTIKRLIPCTEEAFNMYNH